MSGVIQMIKINLLPPDRIKKELEMWSFYRSAAIVCLGLAVLLWGYNLAMYKYGQSEIEEVKSQIASMQVWQQRFDKVQAENQDINKRKAIVKNLSTGSVKWSNLLAELGNITPNGCWLKSVKQGMREGQLVITGSALGMKDLLGFMEVLQTYEGVTSVQLIDATTSESNRIEITNFSIDIQKGGMKK